MLNSGDSLTEIVPVYEGYTLPHAACKMNIGGRNLTHYLRKLLISSGTSFKTTAEFDICRGIKEIQCYIAYSEEDRADNLDTFFTV